MVRKSPPVTAHPETWEIICQGRETAKPREQFERYLSGNYRDTCRSCTNITKSARRAEYMRSWRAANPCYA